MAWWCCKGFTLAVAVKKMVLGKVVSKDAVLAKNRSTPQGAPVDVLLYASAAVMMAVEQSPT